MRRRQFITLIGGAAACPLVAHAQQTPLPVIGILSARESATDAPLLEFFREGLRRSGYIEGQNVAFEYRAASGDYDRLPALATELVEERVQVIVAFGGPRSSIAAKSKTATIPIVFIGGDPVRLGLAKSFNRPGGNITGVFTLFEDVVSKQLALASELLPQAKTIAVLINPANGLSENVHRNILEAGGALAKQVEVIEASSSEEIEASFKRMHSIRADGVLVTVDPLFLTEAIHVVALASVMRSQPFSSDVSSAMLAVSCAMGPTRGRRTFKRGCTRGAFCREQTPQSYPSYNQPLLS